MLHLKMVTTVNSTLCIFSHKKKNWEKVRAVFIMLCCFSNDEDSYFLNIEMGFDYIVKTQKVISNFKMLFEKRI